MSDNTQIDRGQELNRRDDATTTESDNPSNPTSSPQNIKMSNKRDSELSSSQRDCSSVSSDSSQTAKKPASLDEIQDLYSALQDLVKTNVTGTPVLERRQFKTTSAGNSPHIGSRVEMPSPLISSRFHERTSTAPEKSLRQLATKMSKLTPSSSFDKEDTSAKHKRGLSAGTMDMVNSIMRISPFPSRKFLSNDVTTDKGKKLNGKTSKKNQQIRLSSETNKKWKKPRLFHRLRSKGGASNNSEEEDNDDDWSEDSESSPPTTKPSSKTNRRLSEGDALKLREKKKHESNNSCLMHRRSLHGCPADKSLCSQKSFKSIDLTDIDQLVAALALETTDDINIVSRTPTFKSPEHELSRLESWFEKAAAEATMNHSKNLSSTNDDQADEDGQNVNKNSRLSPRKKVTSGRRSAAIRRVSSNVGRTKEDKKSKRGKLASKSFDASAITHAKSTPDLCTDTREETLNNAGTAANSKVLGRLSPFTENNLKDSNTPSRKISLDASIGRLPGVPLFYTPTYKGESGQNLKLVNHSGPEQQKKLLKQYSEDIFYSEENTTTNNMNNIFEKQPSDSSDDITDDVTNQSDDVMRNNTENQQRNKRRPKSMFDYIEHDVFIDEKGLWTTTGKNSDTNIRNSLHMTTGMQTDDNANFCRTKIINSSHALSMSDLSKTSVVQEKSLWDRIRKGSSNKKSKASKLL